MPGFITEVGPPGKTIARATLRIPGQWSELTEQQKQAWNKATMAIHDLFELYNWPRSMP